MALSGSWAPGVRMLEDVVGRLVGWLDGEEGGLGAECDVVR